MGKRVKSALKRAYAHGGSIGPAPKSHKLIGEFRDPTERAGGIPFLIPYGAHPKNIDRALGARRWRDPNEEYPDRGRGLASRADGGSVIDALRHDVELHNAHQPTPEERTANLKTTATDVASVLPVVGNLMSAKDAGSSGRETYEAARSGNLKRALGQAALTGLNTLGVVTGLPWGKAAGRAAAEGSSTARIFAGPGAKTADLAALTTAQEMRAAGADRRAIWDATGWFQGPDEKWRFEIDDSGAKINDRVAGEFARRDVGDQVPVQNHDRFLDHPELFEAYPDLWRVNASLKKGGGYPYAPSGNYQVRESGSERINLDAGSLGQARSMDLHELQHAVQQREKFAVGADLEKTGMKDYVRHAGEVESYNVQRRQDMTPAERQATPPWETQGIPDADQIVKMEHDGVQNVMIPAPESKANDLARDLRSQGVPNAGVMRNADKRFFGPDGSLRTEVDDRGMTLKRDFQPGDRAPMGDVIDHPALFGQRPELRDMPVTFTNKMTTEANQPGRKFGVSRRAPDGSSEITAGQSPEFYKAQLAKLMQYDVAKANNWGAGIRHDIHGVRQDYGNAMRVALDIIDNPRPGEDVGAAMAYLERMRPMYDLLMKPGEEAAAKAYRDAQKLTSGNIDARVVRQRAVQDDAARAAWGPYPYAQGVRGVGPGFQKAQVIPFADAKRADVAKMLADWQEFGTGRGNFANGGRTKARRHALKRARVTVGAVMGRTGGRADALQVSVPAGAYVVPADVVAALGEGNTAAGMAKLEKQFKPTAPKYARGGAVPIHISDGEFVISPDAVAALGGGDAAYGHDVLDAFVVSTRKAYTDHLTNLPGPNQ